MKQSSAPHILLVNPWIYDFAAYNLWSRPLGLLEIGGMLRDLGFRVSFIDCVDAENFSYETSYRPKLTPYGTGKLKRTPVEKPDILSSVPRRYCRYGISPEEFCKHLESLPNPDLILVTSIMTYWYPGVKEAVSLLKARFPHTPLWLGGSYATLIPNHARSICRPDRVIRGPFTSRHLREITDLLGTPPAPSPQTHTMRGLALWEGYKTHHFLCIRTSHGCPYRCRYCASHLLTPRFTEHTVEDTSATIVRLHRLFKIVDFAFYDDALLIHAQTRFIPLMQSLLRTDLSLRFHTPNGIHVRLITQEIANLMKQAGFKTLRLSLETTHEGTQKRLGLKVTMEEFDRTLSYLFKAGFTDKEIRVYLLVGLPEQTFDEIELSVNEVLRRGIRPSLAEYSPIPGTPLWDQACKISPFPLAEEPLTHNNTLLPCAGDGVTKDSLDTLKRQIQSELPSGAPED